MADVDPELMAVREEYERVVGKPPGGRNKNNKDMMLKKIEKVKNPKPKGKKGRPPKGSVLAKAKSPSMQPAPEPATEDSPDIQLSQESQESAPEDSLELQLSQESDDAEKNRLAEIAAQIDPKQFSLVMQLMSRDVWSEGLFCYLPTYVEKALKILEAPDNVFHEDSWDDMDDYGRLRRLGKWFYKQPDFKDLSVQKQMECCGRLVTC